MVAVGRGVEQLSCAVVEDWSVGCYSCERWRIGTGKETAIKGSCIDKSLVGTAT